jgi:hypothetical protein
MNRITLFVTVAALALSSIAASASEPIILDNCAVVEQWSTSKTMPNGDVRHYSTVACYPDKGAQPEVRKPTMTFNTCCILEQNNLVH